MKRIVLDTNCLLQCVSHRSAFHEVWSGFISGKYELCVSTDIMEEYEEILSLKMSPLVARIVIEMILRANNVVRVDARYQFGLIEADVDDNKFVDCAIAANADFIVSEDNHFNVLAQIPFPHVDVIRMDKFLLEVTSSSNDAS